MRENFSKFKTIYIVNESVMFYCLPLIVMIKKRMNFKINLFTMGLFSRMEKKSKRTILQKLIIKYFCLKFVDKFLFIGKGEYSYASDKFSDFKYKMHYVPFGVDTNFWSNKNQFKLNDREYILFVGNDLNIYFEFLICLLKELKKEIFVILS